MLDTQSPAVTKPAVQKLQWETYTRKEAAATISIKIGTLNQQFNRGFGSKEKSKLTVADLGHLLVLNDLVRTGLSQETAYKAALKAAPSISHFVAAYSERVDFIPGTAPRYIVVVSSQILTCDHLSEIPAQCDAHFGRKIPEQTNYFAKDCLKTAVQLASYLPRSPINGVCND